MILFYSIDFRFKNSKEKLLYQAHESFEKIPSVTDYEKLAMDYLIFEFVVSLITLIFF